MGDARSDSLVESQDPPVRISTGGMEEPVDFALVFFKFWTPVGIGNGDCEHVLASICHYWQVRSLVYFFKTIFIFPCFEPVPYNFSICGLFN